MKLGDVIATITKSVGIEPCEACKERQRKLNEWSDTLKNIFSRKGNSDETTELVRDVRTNRKS